MISPVHHAVRTATLADHKRTEESFAATLARLPESYGPYLQTHARAFPAVGRALAQVWDWSPWQERWNDLSDDLAKLGLAPPPAVELAPLRSAAEGLGMIYVLEGSRMGSALLLKSIPSELPTAYLRGGLNTAPWHRAKALLDDALSETEADVIAGARAAFRAFESAARAHLGRSA